MKWYVVYTKPRWEYKVYRGLSAQGIEAFCPRYVTVKQWSDRRKKIKQPYFRSYVFVLLEERDRNHVFRVPGVVKYLFWLGMPAVVPDREMHHIRDYLEGAEYDQIRVERLSRGEEIAFSRGPLKGRAAIVQDVGTNNAVLFLPALGCRVRARLADLV
jgi:transcription antitermination factor NusG